MKGRRALPKRFIVPFAMIGGIVALLLTGLHLSVPTAIGFIALFGQAVLNGVVMVSYFNELREKGAPVVEATTEGAMVWLRTVPMTLSKAIGSEVQKPPAVVIIGGLAPAMILTLIVLPTLYLVMEKAGGRGFSWAARQHKSEVQTNSAEGVSHGAN